eukprot:m.144566 g.144566  ORF g.144566 m.144566 type:complete len:63 (+) comp38404_c0_seq1:2420-2608(+)
MTDRATLWRCWEPVVPPSLNHWPARPITGICCRFVDDKTPDVSGSFTGNYRTGVIQEKICET